MFYFLLFLITFLISLFLTDGVRRLALRFKIVDSPVPRTVLEFSRKIHNKTVALLGGLAIFFAFFLALWYLAIFTDRLWQGQILPKHIWGVFFAGCLLMIGGYLDDKYRFRPIVQILWPIAAALIIIGSGIGIKAITNPLGGVIELDGWKAVLLWYQGLPYYVTFPADVVTFFWLLGMAYTTKLLDGLDGLSAGIAGIGALIIFLFTLTTKYYQPDVAILSLVFAGAVFGFLLLNFHPAKIFLGEGGSLFTGFILGILAVISGAKIAIALLVVGIAALDVLWVILRRIFWERKSPAKADRKHLHFRLLETGLSHRQTVLLFYFLAAAFGFSGLFLQSKQKLIALLVLAVLGIIIGGATVLIYKTKNRFSKTKNTY